MKVTLAKYGGLAAGIRRPPQVVDAAALPKPEAALLHRLAAAAEAAPPVEEEGPGRMRDAMGYTITIEDGGRSKVLEQSDGAMSPEFAALLDWLDRHHDGK